MGYRSGAEYTRKLLTSTLIGAFIAGGAATSALAADLAAPPVMPVMPPVGDFFSTMTHTEQLEGGVVYNPDSPANHNNFGQEFTDKPNEAQFNQLLITFARPIDSTKAYDVGFNLQGLFGADARYDPTLGLLNYTLTGRQQFVFTQANVVVHTPFIAGTNIDTKIGFFPGLMGYETTDPSTRPFYTFSYVTNFLLPFQNTGATATWHVNPTVDIYAGVDTGNETTFTRLGDNNSSPGGYFGFGLNNLLDNKLTVLAISRIAPENPSKLDGTAFFGPGQNSNNTLRFFNDVVLTYKASDKWTFVGEGNYFRDEAVGYGSAYGFDGYASYALNEEITLNTRGEIYRDNTGLVTTGWTSNTAFTDSLAGNNAQIVQVGVPTTYGAITGGVTYKPNWINKAQDVAKVTIRPEVRYDTSLNGTKPFDSPVGAGVNTGLKKDQFLFSTDLIVAF